MNDVKAKYELALRFQRPSDRCYGQDPKTHVQGVEGWQAQQQPAIQDVGAVD